MISYIVDLKCGDSSQKRYNLLQNSDYKFEFRLFDENGNLLNTQESWQGRIAECYIDGIRVFYTNNPEFLNKILQIEKSIILHIVFGYCTWDIQLITETSTVKLVPPEMTLPADISCTNLTSTTARISEFLPSSTGTTKFNLGSGMLIIDGDGGLLVGDSIRTGSYIINNEIKTSGKITASNATLSGNLSASSVTVTETSAVGSGAVNAQNVNTSGLFTSIMRCDDLARFNGNLEINAKATIDTDGELQLNNGAVSLNGDTDIYCPTPKKEGGVTRYQPSIQYLEPPYVQEAGHYLLFKRVYDN